MTEAGFYKLAARSRKPAAIEFDDWVRSVVLPSIRKTGSYSIAGRSTNRPRGDVDLVNERWFSEGKPLSAEMQKKWAGYRVRTAADYCTLAIALSLVVPPSDLVATRIRVCNQLNTSIMGGEDNADIRRTMASIEQEAISVSSPVAIEGEEPWTNKRARDGAGNSGELIGKYLDHGNPNTTDQ